MSISAMCFVLLRLWLPDTRFYWNLTEHIFRYSHRGDRDDLFNGLHTVNEGDWVIPGHCVHGLTRCLAVKGESIMEQIRFFTKFILNCDDTDLF